MEPFVCEDFSVWIGTDCISERPGTALKSAVGLLDDEATYNNRVGGKSYQCPGPRSNCDGLFLFMTSISHILSPLSITSLR